ncbi:MAG: TIM-barrel domain-containing protein [Victivallales bacterium]|jgi:alpha-glucosidase (family GH31 glycosyl hydrolase)
MKSKMEKRMEQLSPVKPYAATAVKGSARFTVIDAACVRMEYSAEYGFTDEPTLFAFNRQARCDNTRISSSANALTIETDRIRIDYHEDGKPFHAGNLRVAVLEDGREIHWTPGMKNERNLGGPLPTLDGLGDEVPLPDGLLSRDGWHLIDDSGKPVLADGWIQQRRGSAKSGFDWYFFGYGSDYKAAFSALAAISGKAPLPRRHVFGSWYCRWHKYTADDFRAIVNEYRDHDFPLDIMVMDMDWHTLEDATTGYGHANMLGWTGYTWNKKLIPDPEGLLKEFRDDGIFVTLNDHPCDGVREHEECYEHFMKLAGKRPEGRKNLPYDAGDPRYMEAFFKAALDPLEKQGIDFWWVDWQQDYVYPYVRGVPNLRHLPWLNYLYYKNSERSGRRGQAFSRWGGWGDHRHPIHFSGDATANWKMLAFEIPFTLASGNTGCFFWAHDIGGFYGERDPEAYVRWVQFGALSASLRLHSTGDKLDRRPWLWGEQMEGAMRSAFHLRVKLFPYIYTGVRQCHDKCLPLLRPLYLEYPNAEESYRYRHQYLFGENIFVSPVITKGAGPDFVAEKTVWFPPDSRWYNIFSGERFEGGNEVTVKAAIDEIPLYARAGTPIPMQPYTPRMSDTSMETLTVRCYPGEEGESVLYEDDGQTDGYLKGKCAWTKLYYRRCGNKTVVKVEPSQGRFKGQPRLRKYRIELPCTRKATSATLDDSPVAFEYDESSWMNIVTVPARAVGKAVEVTVETVEIDPDIPRANAAKHRREIINT